MNDLAGALGSGFLLGDGAMGTYLAAGDPGGTDGPVELLALTRPDRVEAAHVAYLNAGSQFIETHTFGLSPLRLKRLGGRADGARVFAAAARAARRAVEAAGQPAYILGSLGPTGLRGDALNDPVRTEALFEEQAEALTAGGVDGWIVETLSDPREWIAALRGIRHASDLPIITTVSLSAEGLSRDGYGLGDFLQALFAAWDARPNAFGLGCGAGPAPLLSHVRRLRQALSEKGLTLPLAVQPNAGLPTLQAGQVRYGALPAYFGESAPRWLAAGASILGACCGSTPAHVSALARAMEQILRETPLPTPDEIPLTEPTPWEEPFAGPRVWSQPSATPSPSAGATTKNQSSTDFWISLEIDPPKGARVDRMLQQATLARDSGADGVNVADSPMARVRMGSLAAAALIEQRVGIPTLLHFTTRDRNLMGIQADLLGAHALGLRSILALTGDPPGLGDYAQATAVYDLDSVGLLRLLTHLNSGQDALGNSLAGQTAFHLSAGADPGAPDLDATVLRTREKIDAGATRLLTQPIYEAQTLIDFLEALDRDVEIILGVMPLLTARQADYLHHEVPGIRIPDSVRQAMRSAGDLGERCGAELAEELVDRLKPWIQGVYVIPSLGRLRGPLQLVRTWRSRYTSDVEGNGPLSDPTGSVNRPPKRDGPMKARDVP